MLDEPSEGVQPENIERMSMFIQRRKSAGLAFLVIVQHLHLAEAIADEYQVLDNGRCVLEGKADQITRDHLLRQITV